MSILLENFLDNFKMDWYTIPGSHIHCGSIRSQGYSPSSSKNSKDCFSVMWIITGKGYISENRRTHPITDMSCCVCRPDREWETVFSDEESIRMFFRLPEEMYLALTVFIPELTNLPPVKPVEYSDDLLREYLILNRKCKNISVTDFHTVWQELVNFILHLTGISAARSSSSLDNARRMLEDTASGKSLEKIAEECNMNYNTFRKQFAAAYDLSPGRYRMLCKIEAAKDALYSGASIKETAEKYGFSDVYSFTHCFKSVVGAPPSQYRERVMTELPRKPDAVPGDVLHVEYKTGTINARDGQENPTNNTRLHPPDYIPLCDVEGVTVKEGYQLTWLAYGKDRRYLGNGNNFKGLWQLSGVPIRCADILAIYPEAVYFRFAIKNVSWVNLSLFDVIKSGVTIVPAGGSLSGGAEDGPAVPPPADKG